MLRLLKILRYFHIIVTTRLNLSNKATALA
uniref:Uncharacterized protein n=1 Tax=virus sp. ctML55 TaxID=2827627 RepID=A0A8S5RHY8_9VIRU|nr:MAG TPA: hypothetical protein [virus sp. ctML55]DAV60044.1 MAG TPA: hypothetical protein [Caudoviricetes sp.]DAX00427.1 MAG TPA: hypothetical protein [Bacteriophage sp.]